MKKKNTSEIISQYFTFSVLLCINENDSCITNQIAVWSKFNLQCFYFISIFSLRQMRDENLVLGYWGQLEQHVFRASVPLRAPDSQDKAFSLADNYQRPIRVEWVNPQGLTFAPLIYLDDKNRTLRFRLKTYETVSIMTVHHVSHTLMIYGLLY